MPPPLQEAADGGIGFEADGALIGLVGRTDFAHPDEEIGARCPVTLMVGEARIHRLGDGAGVDSSRRRDDGYISQIGRTSTDPWEAPGQRAAQVSAWSRSATSIMK